MDAMKFLQTYGEDEAARVSEAAGSKLSYFKHLAYGHRKASPQLAQRLVKASGGRLTLTGLRPDIYGVAA